ncbi:thioredoxin family protein [Ulvibacterium sp.]|uniref:thioredoxin family protein n=1 Tax=Ulvibacterium sp. TaxID=2665914 RepID=UPI002613AD23|nr:thioredoxin family protein [Ulvibacterium sp.]
MKTSVFLFFTVLATGLFGQNQEVFLKDGRPFLLGKITLEAFEKEPYRNWYQKSYLDYGVDETLIRLFKLKLADCRIQLFLGTWCGDSKREVPRFIKILREADFPLENLEIIALDRRKEWYKKSPGGEEKGKNIKKVPTMLFLKNGTEINRIVESPVESLEEDMALILNGDKYVPNYAVKKQ